MDNFEKVFPEDIFSKKERVLRTLNHQSVDRVAIHEQLSYNGQVIAHFTGKDIKGFEFTPDDVGVAIRKTLDTCFPIFENKGTGTVKTADGFVMKNDNWTTWRVSRPFTDEAEASEWLKWKIRWMGDTGYNDHTAVKVEADGFETSKLHFDAARERKLYREYMQDLQEKVGDTLIIDFSFTGFCDLFDAMGLEIYSFFSLSYPDLLKSYMDLAIENELRRVHAVADNQLSPLILIPEDFATKAGPIFGPGFLERYHYPYIEQLAAAWHEHGFTVIYHSDGNYREAIPALLSCGVDGFYCLEPSCGMDILELNRQYPQTIWAGGIDGVNLMERGTPDQVKEEVHRQIEESRALEQGGILLATSSEINPTISLENYLAMIEAAGECRSNLSEE